MTAKMLRALLSISILVFGVWILSVPTSRLLPDGWLEFRDYLGFISAALFVVAFELLPVPRESLLPWKRFAYAFFVFYVLLFYLGAEFLGGGVFIDFGFQRGFIAAWLSLLFLPISVIIIIVRSLQLRKRYRKSIAGQADSNDISKELAN